MKFSSIILTFVSSFASVTSSHVAIELDTNEGDYFSLNYTIVGRSGGPFTSPLIHTSGGRLPEHFRQRLNVHLNISAVDGQSLIGEGFLHGVPGESRSVIHIGFDSAFSRLIHSYMMIPMHRQLIINPEIPENFVYHRALATTRSTSDEYPQVRISVSVLNTTRSMNGELMTSTIQSTEARDFAIATVVSEDYVPSSIIRALYDELRRRGVQCDPGRAIDGNLISFDIFGDNVSDEILDTFPIIQYQIHTDSGNDVSIQLYGSDYFGPIFSRNTRELLLHSVENSALGLNTLSKIALFIDNRNRTIGFGDPL